MSFSRIFFKPKHFNNFFTLNKFNNFFLRKKIRWLFFWPRKEINVSAPKKFDNFLTRKKINNCLPPKQYFTPKKSLILCSDKKFNNFLPHFLSKKINLRVIENTTVHFERFIHSNNTWDTFHIESNITMIGCQPLL